MSHTYGYPAPCRVTRIDGGPALMVEPLRFVPVSELPSGRTKGRAPVLNYGARAGGGVPFSAPPATPFD